MVFSGFQNPLFFFITAVGRDGKYNCIHSSLLHYADHHTEIFTLIGARISHAYLLAKVVFSNAKLTIVNDPIYLQYMGSYYGKLSFYGG